MQVINKLIKNKLDKKPTSLWTFAEHTILVNIHLYTYLIHILKYTFDCCPWHRLFLC